MSSLVGSLFRGASQVLGGVADSFSKAEPNEGPERAPGGSQADHAGNAPMPTEQAKQDPQSLLADPFSIIEQLGYKDRPSAVTYNTLKAIVWKMPVIADVILTRVNQIAQFATPTHDRFQIGFRIKLRDTTAQPTGADKKFIKAAESFFMRTGLTDNPRGRVSFEHYLRMISWDMLRFDQDCTEIVPNRKGQPAEFYAVDASSIRLADSARLHVDEDLDEAIRYVQLYDNMIITQYTQEELIFGVRNPSTDMKLHGYGVSELELVMNAITSLLWAWDYNSRVFSQGSLAKGLLNIKSAMAPKQLSAFKRQWYSMISGVENAWRTPILNTENDVQWLNMQNTNRDMEFNSWMDFLIKVICAAYSMDPSEVNFKYGSVGMKSALTEDSNRDKVMDSQERGLRPLLRHIASNLNTHILWPINESFEFEFMGLDSMTREEVAALNQTLVMTYRTIDEVRAADDLPPLPDGAGNILLNPTYVQYMQVVQQQQMQQQQQAQQGGDPSQDAQGDGGGAGGFDDQNQNGFPDAPSDQDPKGAQRKLQLVAASDDFDDEDDGDEDEAVDKSLDHPRLRVDLRL